VIVRLEQIADELRSGTRPWWFTGADAEAGTAYYDDLAQRQRDLLTSQDR
jgi:hypothetical protein